jgi:predicted ABC-type ATPase
LNQHQPALLIIAGPLGAGKTTFYEAYLKEAFPMLVPGARHQQRAFLKERRSFAVEDVCVDVELLDEAKAAGYTTKVLFICTEDANLNVGRILVRRSRGGNSSPASTVIDSYRESTKNLLEVRKHADEVILYDNTAHDRGYRVVAQFTGGELSKAAQTIPDWAAKVFGKELRPAVHRAKSGRAR